MCASWHVSFWGCLSSTLFCQKILPAVFHASRNIQKCSGTTVLGKWLRCKVVFGLLFGGKLNYNFAQARSQCEWPAGRKSYADITISFYIYMLYYDKKKIIPCRQDLHFLSLGLWRKHDSSELQRLRYQQANKNKLSYNNDFFFPVSLFLCQPQGFRGLNSEIVSPQGRQKYWL